MSLWTDLFGSKQKVQQTSLQSQTSNTAQTQNQTQTQAQQSETQGSTSQTQTGASTTAQQQQQQTSGTTKQASTQKNNQAQTSDTTQQTQQNVTQSQVSDVLGQVTGATTANEATATSSSADISSLVSKLDPATLQMLKDLVPGLEAGLPGAGNSGRVQTLDEIAKTFMARASDNSDLESIIGKQQQAAKEAYQYGEGAQVELTQQGIGSRMNTFSDLAASHGSADLAAQVAGIDANTRLAYAAQQQQDLKSAMEAASAAESGSLAEKSAAIGNLMNVVGQISGAVTTTTGKQTQQGQGTTAQTGTSQQQQQQTTKSSGQTGTTGTTFSSTHDVLEALMSGTTDTDTAAQTLSALTGQTYTSEQMQQVSDTLQTLQALSELTGTATSDTTATAQGQSSGSTTNNPGLISGLFASIGSLFGGSHY